MVFPKALSTSAFFVVQPKQVRYRPGEKFTWHLDALPPTPELPGKGGQRIATLLVYLTELPEGDGGATAFRDLGPLRVRPRKVWENDCMRTFTANYRRQNMNSMYQSNNIKTGMFFFVCRSGLLNLELYL